MQRETEDRNKKSRREGEGVQTNFIKEFTQKKSLFQSNKANSFIKSFKYKFDDLLFLKWNLFFHSKSVIYAVIRISKKKLNKIWNIFFSDSF